jgi:hypothetical protein
MPRPPAARPQGAARSKPAAQKPGASKSRTLSTGASKTGASKPTSPKQPTAPTRSSGRAAHRQTVPLQPPPHRSSGRGVRTLWIALSALPLCGLVLLVVWIGAAGAARDDLTGDPFVSGPVTDEPADIPLTAPGTVPEPEAPAAAAATGGIAETADAAWLDSVSASTGIPRRALAAYAGAALRLAGEQPGCQIGWTTLAGIGQIESGHASYGGAALLADGNTDRAIRGPALDGDPFMAIPDSDGGAWDGDSEWDRAVGPVQFIPQTWARWGADGNNDGVTNPNQIDDAVLAAARYLCHSGDLSGVEGWRAAIFSYNHDNAYVDAVAERANQYARAS